MEHTSNSNLTREERRIELEQISRGKNGMLELHRLHHLASGNKAGVSHLNSRSLKKVMAGLDSFPVLERLLNRNGHKHFDRVSQVW